MERLARALVRARPWNGFINGRFISDGWTAQPDYNWAQHCKWSC